MVQGLMVRLGNGLFDPFHVLGVGLEQPANVVLNRPVYRPRSLAKVAAEAGTKVQEALPDRGQHPHLGIGIGIGGRVFFRAFVGVIMILFVKPCLLTRIGLSFFIIKIQINKSDKVELETV
jgi:hypothetical protein